MTPTPHYPNPHPPPPPPSKKNKRSYLYLQARASVRVPPPAKLVPYPLEVRLRHGVDGVGAEGPRRRAGRVVRLNDTDLAVRNQQGKTHTLKTKNELFVQKTIIYIISSLMEIGFDDNVPVLQRANEPANLGFLGETKTIQERDMYGRNTIG